MVNDEFWCTWCGRLHGGTGCPPPLLDTRTPFTCPVCNGAKTVSRPPWVAGDIAVWGGSTTESYPCPACDGTGIVWRT